MRTSSIWIASWALATPQEYTSLDATEWPISVFLFIFFNGTLAYAQCNIESHGLNDVYVSSFHWKCPYLYFLCFHNCVSVYRRKVPAETVIFLWYITIRQFVASTRSLNRLISADAIALVRTDIFTSTATKGGSSRPIQLIYLAHKRINHSNTTMQQKQRLA